MTTNDQHSLLVASIEYARRRYGSLRSSPLGLTYDSGPELTPEEKAEYERLKAAAIERIPKALAALEAIDYPVSREVLMLHSRDDHGDCNGCDGGPAYSGEWPCRTVQLIAHMHGISLAGYHFWLTHERRSC